VPVYDLHRSPVIIASSGTAVPLTGSTSVVTLATISLPANLLGLNGAIRLWSLWSAGANNVNAKTGRIMYSGAGGSTLRTFSLASLLSMNRLDTIRNNGTTNGQKFFVGSSGVILGSSTTVIGTSAIDTTAATSIVLTGQLADGTDTLTLESYTAEFIRGDG
jgi:hypothetical protein